MLLCYFIRLCHSVNTYNCSYIYLTRQGPGWKNLHEDITFQPGSFQRLCPSYDKGLIVCVGLGTLYFGYASSLNLRVPITLQIFTYFNVMLFARHMRQGLWAGIPALLLGRKVISYLDYIFIFLYGLLCFLIYVPFTFFQNIVRNIIHFTVLLEY